MNQYIDLSTLSNRELLYYLKNGGPSSLDISTTVELIKRLDNVLQTLDRTRKALNEANDGHLPHEDLFEAAF